MEERDKKTELLVGLFLFIGLLLLGGLILQFGSLKELMKDTYEISAPFPDGTGIREGTPVMLGGSKIGKVPRLPMLNEQFNGVIIPLEIYNDKKIPIDAKFKIGTAGLLGDSYIEIRPTGQPAKEYIQPGAVLGPENVKTGQGISEITDVAVRLGNTGEQVLQDMRGALDELKESMAKVNNGALNDENIGHFKKSLESLDNVTRRVDEKVLGDTNADNLSAAINDLKLAAASFKATAVTVDGSTKKIDGMIDKLDPAIAQADKLMKTATDTMASFSNGAKNFELLTKDMAKGEGLFKALMTDAELRNDFKALISNLKRNGVIWYDDDAEKVKAKEQAKKQQQNQSSGGIFRRPGH
jgi:phospholipid/cholesterol/gamma-HCH transport system substrate-binding protein